MSDEKKSVWGNQETEFFLALTPEKILDAIETSTGLRCTGRVLALNSMENRVYEVEIEMDTPPKNPSERFLICKFYRPGRWSYATILDEHQFLLELKDAEIPVVAPLPFLDGRTLHELDSKALYYTTFPKCAGRSPDELNDDQLAQVGRLLARMHGVGAMHTAPHRMTLNPVTYGLENLRYLMETNSLPLDVSALYEKTVQAICSKAEPLFQACKTQRIHGDCHFGNLIFGREGFSFVDFDDMINGPIVQDIWLVIPGRDQESKMQLEMLIEGYEMMRPFDRAGLKLIEPLRALRFVHFSAWIARRWQDGAFPKAFPNFGTAVYWRSQLQDLQEQLDLI